MIDCKARQPNIVSVRLANITMRDVAEKAGVARSTVSKALRNDPMISAKLTSRVHAAAKQLGYAPHPMVSALMAQIHGRRRRTDPHHIAWIDLWPQGKGPDSVPFWSQHLAGARERAAELGYNVEVHEVVAKRITPARLRQILTSRTQWGMIIPPVPESAMQYLLDLRGLTGVTIGTSLRSPVMHRVCHNHYQGAQLACDRLRAMGFTRIGLALTATVNDRVGGKWYGGYMARQRSWPGSEKVEPVMIGENGKGDLKRWLVREKPDAILVGETLVGEWMQELCPTLPVAWLVLGNDQTKRWGIDQLPLLVGRAAVELVVGQINRNERGSPQTPHTLLLDGNWVDGTAGAAAENRILRSGLFTP